MPECVGYFSETNYLCGTFLKYIWELGKFSQYKVQLAAIPEGKFEQDFVCDTAFFREMESIDVMGGEVRAHLELSHKNGAYDCLFTLKGVVEIACDRCLEAMDHEVSSEYHIVVKYGPEYDDSSDEVLIIPESEAWLDVSQMLLDTILLTIPIRHIHSPGGCNPEMAEKFELHLADSDDEQGDDEDFFDEAEGDEG